MHDIKGKVDQNQSWMLLKCKILKEGTEGATMATQALQTNIIKARIELFTQKTPNVNYV